MSLCPHQGKDPRLLHWLICPLQRFLEFAWKSEPVPSITLAIVPPLLIINVPLFWKDAVPLAGAGAPCVPVLHLRAGFRRDMNTGTYLLSFAAKIEERTKLW